MSHLSLSVSLSLCILFVFSPTLEGPRDAVRSKPFKHLNLFKPLNNLFNISKQPINTHLGGPRDAVRELGVGGAHRPVARPIHGAVTADGSEGHAVDGEGGEIGDGAAEDGEEDTFENHPTL